MKIDLPDSFIQKVQLTFGEAGKIWLKNLPALTEKYLKIWDLNATGSFGEHLSFNFVLPVQTSLQTPAVLKLGPHLRGRAKEADALRFYQGEGAVHLLKNHLEDGVSLIERAEPGTELKTLFLKGLDQQATEIAAEVMQRLLQNTAPQNKFTSVSIWGLGFEKFLRENRRGVDFPIETVQKADRLFKEMCSTAKKETLLHADLHHSNILKAQRQPWLAIDPKGMWGDPAYEVGAFLRNPMPELLGLENLADCLRQRLMIFERKLHFQKHRLWAWSYSQSVLAAIWSVEDGQGEWRNWLKVATALESLEGEFLAGS